MNISQHFFLTSHSMRGRGRVDCCVHSKWEIGCVACYSFFAITKETWIPPSLKKAFQWRSLLSVSFEQVAISECVQSLSSIIPPAVQVLIMIYYIFNEEILRQYVQPTAKNLSHWNCCFCVKDWVSNNHTSKKPHFHVIMRGLSFQVFIKRVPSMNKIWCRDSLTPSEHTAHSFVLLTIYLALYTSVTSEVITEQHTDCELIEGLAHI